MSAVDFAAVFEHAPSAAMLLDRELCFVAANAAYLRVTGMTIADLAGRYLFDVFPHDPANPGNEPARVVRESLERVLRTGRPDVLPLIPYRVPGGSVDGVGDRYWSATHTPILDAGGQVAFVLQHTADVTATHERETLIARERAARAFLAETIPQQVWTAAPTGELTFVNRRVREFFNATEEQILGAGWQAVVHPDDLAGVLARWSNCLETGEEYEVEFRLRRHDGTYRWHLGRGLAQLDDDGTILQWFGTNTDMDELTRVRDELRQRVAFERQVIGIVSHDLRNPLDAIGVGSALMLKRGGLDEAQQKVMRRLAASATRAGRMVRDFLDFTQARVSGALPVSKVEANLAQIARQAFDEIRLVHPERRVRVEHTGERTARLDPDRIAQVVGNLAGNAFQHSGADGEVRLTTAGTADEMMIEVRNRGGVIPPEDLMRLFEPFERGAGAKTSSGRSLGLGLYIAKQIVAAHGGTIAVRSTEADGTIFTVRLPRR